MVVWLGAAAVVAGTATLGFLVAENLARRPQHLHQLRTALQVLQTEIDYAATPLPEALERAGRHLRPPVHDLLAAAAERLRQAGEEGAAAAWAAAVAAVDGAMAWTARDREAVLALGPSLGTSHREDQLRHLQLCAARLEAAEAEARQAAQGGARLARYLGVLSGLVIVVLAL